MKLLLGKLRLENKMLTFTNDNCFSIDKSSLNSIEGKQAICELIDSFLTTKNIRDKFSIENLDEILEVDELYLSDDGYELEVINKEKDVFFNFVFE